MAEEAPRAVPFRGGGFAPRLRHAVGAATLIVLIVLWSVAARRGWISPIALPPPEEVAAALVRLARSGELARHLEASLWRLLTGFTLGALAGIGVGLAIGLVSLIRSAGVPLIAALFPIPKIALLPLFIVWFGIGEASKIATIAFGAFFPVAIATYGGVDGVDRSLIRMAQSFGLPARSIVRKIVLPRRPAGGPVGAADRRIDRHHPDRRRGDDRSERRHRRLHPRGRQPDADRPARRRGAGAVAARPDHRRRHRRGGTLPAALALERDDLSSNRHPALAYCWSMIFSENRYHPGSSPGQAFSGSCSGCGIDTVARKRGPLASIVRA